jgi:thymidylate synthase (FAD)
MKIADISVELLDSMGDDLAVVSAARVSFDKESDWENAEWGHPDFEEPNYLKQSDKKLIAYLAKHNHWSPFSHCFLKFRIKAPMFCAAQLKKHTVGLAWNEVSRRYVDSEPEFYLPSVFHGRPKDKKQGSGEPLDTSVSKWRRVQAEINARQAMEVYNEDLAMGMCPEEARMFLPQNTMTSWIWSGSLYAFARVVNLRTAPDAQKAATQDVGNAIKKHLFELFPESAKVLCDTPQQ